MLLKVLNFSNYEATTLQKNSSFYDVRHLCSNDIKLNEKAKKDSPLSEDDNAYLKPTTAALFRASLCKIKKEPEINDRHQDDAAVVPFFFHLCSQFLFNFYSTLFEKNILRTRKSQITNLKFAS